MLLAIDPGTRESAWVLMDDELRPVEYAIEDNERVLNLVGTMQYKSLAVEWVTNYGANVGADVFQTVYWIGRFCERAMERGIIPLRIARRDVKKNLKLPMKAKDGDVMRALIKRFGGRKSKDNPNGFFPPDKSGWGTHLWQAYAVGATFADSLPFDDVEEEDGAV